MLPPFNVYCQVVNTGEQARRANQLRGEIFPYIQKKYLVVLNIF